MEDAMRYIKIVLTVIAILLALNIVKSMISSATATSVQDVKNVKSKLEIVQNKMEEQKLLNEKRREERKKDFKKLHELASEIDKYSQG